MPEFTSVQRALILAAVVTLLLGVVFGRYFLGEQIPPWDFLGSYNTEAFAWWTDGGFFSPPDWVPYAWGGYPAALSIQNSAWYLPVGFAAWIAPYSLHTSAIVSALHVALGAVGTYVLVRSFKMPFAVAVMAAVAGFFAVGHYSNAQHLDIGRGYALLPWILSALSPSWPWQRWWGAPLAGVLFWQTVTGVYPGILTALMYGGTCWVALQQWMERPRFRAFLLPLSLASVSALLLSAPRLLPYLLLSGDTATGFPEQSWFNFPMLGTLLFGYGSSELPNNISMRSFFIPVTVLALAFFANFKDRSSRASLTLMLPALLLGMPFLPWFKAAQQLPGLGLSRYTMSDFKPLLVLSVVLLACSGLVALQGIAFAHPRRIPRSFWVRLGLLLALGVLLYVIAQTGIYNHRDWVRPLLSLGIAITAISAVALTPRAARLFPAFVACMLVLTALSGILWARTTSHTWTSGRLISERHVFGDTVLSLIRQRQAPAEQVQRPERIHPGTDLSAAALFRVQWNRSYYSGQAALGGLVNLKGSETQRRLVRTLADSRTGPAFAAFMSAPGTLLGIRPNALPTAEDFAGCASNPRTCGVADVEPISYAPGRHEYRVTTPEPISGLLNEAYFAGWQARLCAPGVDGCRSLDVSRSEEGVVRMDLPAGTHHLHLAYVTQGRTAGWILFLFGVVVLLLLVLIRPRDSNVPGRSPAS